MPEGRGLFEVAREKIRTRHLAFRTEQAYLHWMRRYVKFHGRRHPRDMGPVEVGAFLTHLAVEAKVAASTQNQALQALLFLGGDHRTDPGTPREVARAIWEAAQTA